jgi:hypothetical protein
MNLLKNSSNKFYLINNETLVVYSERSKIVVYNLLNINATEYYIDKLKIMLKDINQKYSYTKINSEDPLLKDV